MINFKITKPSSRKKNYTLTIDNSKSNVPLEYANRVVVSVIGDGITRNGAKILSTKKSPEPYLAEIRKKIYSPMNKIEGGLGDNRTIENLAKKYKVKPIHYKKIYAAIDAGIGVEKEHTDDIEKQKEIAFDHIWETGMLYYKELSKMEKKLEANPVKFEEGAEVGDDNDRMRMLALKAKADADALALLELEMEMGSGETKVESKEESKLQKFINDVTFDQLFKNEVEIPSEFFDAYEEFVATGKFTYNDDVADYFIQKFNLENNPEKVKTVVYWVSQNIKKRDAKVYLDKMISEGWNVLSNDELEKLSKSKAKITINKDVKGIKYFNVVEGSGGNYVLVHSKSKKSGYSPYSLNPLYPTLYKLYSESIETKPVESEPETAPQKEAWEMTFGEYVEDLFMKKGLTAQMNGRLKKNGKELSFLQSANEKKYAKSSHKEIVQKALSEGKPVPAEVLADYPELQKSEPEASSGTPKVVRDAYYIFSNTKRGETYDEVQKLDEFEMAGRTWFSYKDKWGDYGVADLLTGAVVKKFMSSKEDAEKEAKTLIAENEAGIEKAISDYSLSARYRADAVLFIDSQKAWINELINERNFKDLFEIISNRENKVSRDAYSEISGFKVNSATSQKEIIKSFKDIYGYDLEAEQEKAEKEKDVQRKAEAERVSNEKMQSLKEKYPFINFDGIKPMELARLESVLEKKWRFGEDGIMSKGEFLKKHWSEFNEKDIYEEKYTRSGEERAKPLIYYNLWKMDSDGRRGGHDVEKLIYDRFILKEKMSAGGFIKCPVGTQVQSVLMSKDNFSRKEAVKWVKEHDYSIEIDETENYYRFRQQEPEQFEEESFRTIEFTDGIKAVIGCPLNKKMERGDSVKYDRAGNPIGEGSWHIEPEVFEFPEYPQIKSSVDYSQSTESTYVTYLNTENDKKITVRFSQHESNAVRFGDQLDGNFASKNEILYHLGLKKREFIPKTFLSIPNRQVAKKKLGNYEEADKTIQEMYALGANADISMYNGKIAKGSNYLIMGDTVEEIIDTRQGSFGNPVELGKYVYSDIDENNTKAEQGMKINDGTILYRVTKNENLTKENIRLPFHAGTLEQAERIADIKDYGNDAVYYKIILDENARIYTTSDTVANILDKEIRKEITVSIGKNILNDCISVVMRNVKTNEIIPFINTNGEATPFVNLQDKDASDFLYLHENSDYDAIRYENEIEGDGYSYLILTDKFKIEKMSGTKAEKGMKIDADINGGAAYEGYLHTDGGIPATVKETGQEIEFEVGEIVINRVDAQKHCEELSKINSEHGKKIDCDCLRNSNKDENLKDPKMEGEIDETGMVKLEKGDSIDKNMEKTLSNEGNIIQDTIENQEVELEEMEAATMFENGDKIGGKQRHYKFRDDSFFVVDWVEQDGKQVAVLVDKQPRNKWFSIGESSADQILEDAEKAGLSFDEMLKRLIQNGAFVNIHAEGAAISNEYPHPFVKAIDEQIIKAGKEYRAIEDAIYGLAGDRNKQKRQEVISAIVGDKVPAAKSGISAIEEELKKWILAKYPNANVTKRFEPILKEEAKADTTEKEAWEMTLDEYVEEKSKDIPEGSISDLRAEFHNEYYNAIQKHLENNGQISQRVYEQLDPVFKNRTVAKYRNPISGTEPKTETIPENIPIEVAKSNEYQEAYRKYENGEISLDELENFRNLPKVETVGRYVLGMEWEKDFPNADMLETGKKAKINWGVENLKKLADSFTDNNFHTAVKPLYAAISYLKKDMKGEAEKELKAFRANCQVELSEIEEMAAEKTMNKEPEITVPAKEYDAEYEADILSRFEKALENFAETKNKDFIVRKYGDNSQTVEGTLNEYITEIVVKANQPQKLETYYSLLEKAGYAKNKADMRFLYTYINNDDEIGSIDRLANFTIFSNSGINLFELIPDKFKKTQSVKTVSYRLDHKDEGLKSILKSFAGKDNIRPILGGIHFDEHGVVVTDAQKLAFINGKVKETGTYCITKDCFEAYTDEKGKLHQPIEKYPLGEHNKYPAYVGVIPYNNSERNVISTIGIEIYANAMMKSGLLNDSFLSTAYKIGETAIYLDAERVLDCIKFMRQLGYDKIEISASTSTRGVLFMPVGGAVKAHHLDNPFALLMPLFSEGFNEGTVYFDCNDEAVKVYSEKKGIPEIVITPDYFNVKELEKTKKQLREETESVKKQLKDEVEQAKALAKAELEAEKERLKKEKNDEAKRKADEKIKADMAAARAKKTKEDAENARKEAEEKAELEKKESSEANDKNRMRMLALKAKADADALALIEIEMEMEDGIDVSSPIGIETQIENVLSGSESDSEKKTIEKKVEYARKNISNIKKMNGSKVYDLSIEQNEFDVWIFRYNLKKTGKSTGQKYYYPVQFAEIEYVENMGNVAFDAYKYAVKNNLYKKYHDDITGMVSEYLEAYNISANENEIKEISEKFSLTLIDVIIYSGVVYSEDALNFGTSEEYLEFLKNKSKSKRSEAIERVANISPARRLYTEIKPKNKKEEVYFDKADALYDAIEKYYDPNYFTESNVSKSMILSKERSYPTKRGTLKEGIMIKNLPYSGYFKVNVFAIYGETTFDAGEGKLYGGKQVGRILTYQGLPTKDELIDDMILIYLVEMQKPEMISDEGSKSGRTKLFPKTKDFITAKNYKDYLDVKIPDEWLTNESTEEINKLQEFDEK